MSFLSDNCDELDEIMATILVQRVKSGEHLQMTESEIEDAVVLYKLVTEREGEDYYDSLMDEVVQTFIERQIDAAEAAVELQRDREVEHGQEKVQDKGKGGRVPKSTLAPAQVHQKVEEGVSNAIPMYCFHYGDPECKPPVEGKVCHKISPETFNCTMWLAGPTVKCRFLGHDENGQPKTVIGCALSPYVEFERLRERWLNKGRKMNPLKASRRARRGM